MHIMTADFWASLMAIVLIDLVLAGDNAIVIGMAARNLPHNKQKQAIFWGSAGAIVVRVLMTVLVVWLLKIPALMMVGGMLLLWIAFKLMTDDKKHANIQAQERFWAAVRTIVVADGVMGLDNVLGITGVAHGNLPLIILGMLITVPLIMWGSTAFVRLIERYPVILYIGGAILVWTGGSMIAGETLLRAYLSAPQAGLMLKVALTAAVFLAVRFRKRRTAPVS